ncbi:unnamed protein product, partial [Iphiclides podalirius]
MALIRVGDLAEFSCPESASSALLIPKTLRHRGPGSAGGAAVRARGRTGCGERARACGGSGARATGGRCDGGARGEGRPRPGHESRVMSRQSGRGASPRAPRRPPTNL